MNPLEVAQQILDEEIAEDAKALFKKNRDEKGVKGTAEDAHKDEDDLEQLDEVEHDDDDEAAASLQSKNVSDKQSMRTEGVHEMDHEEGYHEGRMKGLMAGYHEAMKEMEHEEGMYEGEHDDDLEETGHREGPQGLPPFGAVAPNMPVLPPDFPPGGGPRTRRRLSAGYHEDMHDDLEEGDYRAVAPNMPVLPPDFPPGGGPRSKRRRRLSAGYHEGMHEMDHEEGYHEGYHEGVHKAMKEMGHEDEEELMAGMHEGFEEAGINYGEEEEKSFASIKAAIEGGKGRASRGAASGSTASQDIDTDNLPENVEFELEEEQIGAMFEGTDLEEDFKFRAKVIFEEAVNDRVREIQSELQERYSDWASDKVSSIRDNLVERVDSYLNYVITEWVKENELALENGIRNEINESFINGLKTLFETHNISYPDSQVSVVDGLYEQMQQEQLKREELAKYYDNKINEELQKNIELNEEIEELRRDQIIREATEDLPLSQVDRLESLAEDVDFVDENSFAKSMKTLRESYVPSKRNLVIQDDIDMLAEGNTSENKETENLSESMQSYSQALSRYGKN